MKNAESFVSAFELTNEFGYDGRKLDETKTRSTDFVNTTKLSTQNSIHPNQ